MPIIVGTLATAKAKTPATAAAETPATAARTSAAETPTTAANVARHHKCQQQQGCLQHQRCPINRWDVSNVRDTARAGTGIYAHSNRYRANIR